MPLLLYCITEPGFSPVQRLNGVRGGAVDSALHSGLRCFYSRLNDLPSDAESLKRDALAFYAVTRALFDQSAIIPFRFPTTLDSLPTIEKYLHEHAAAYQNALAGLRDKVQIDIRISPAQPRGPSATGAEYLKTRARQAHLVEQAINTCRAAIHREVIDWQQRQSQHGVRCFVLIRREAVGRVQHQIQNVRLDPAITVSVSGPWPATEFLPSLA